MPMREVQGCSVEGCNNKCVRCAAGNVCLPDNHSEHVCILHSDLV
jgi:hypothetical protein